MHAGRERIAGERGALLGTDVDAPAQQLVELLVLDGAAAVGVESVEERARLFLAHLDAQRRHRLGELVLRDQTVLVLIPVAEEVDDAHGIVRERIAQQLMDRPAALAVELDRGRERRALAPTRVAAQLILLLGEHARVLLELALELELRDRAALVVVELVEDLVNVRVADVREAERAHRPPELESRHLAVVVLIPGAENFHDACYRSGERVSK